MQYEMEKEFELLKERRAGPLPASTNGRFVYTLKVMQKLRDV